MQAWRRHFAACPKNVIAGPNAASDFGGTSLVWARMKRTLPLFCALATALTSYTASAFTYSDYDLLLVLRQDGLSDVEFNLGSVTNYLGKADGTVITVTNFDVNLAKSSFNNNLVGVKFILMAATNSNAAIKRAYLTDADPASVPTDITVSSWRTLQSKISFVGIQAAINTASNSTESYVISPSDTSAYTYIATDGGPGDVTSIAGTAPFLVENPIPGTSRFFEVKGINPAVNPSIQIGSFSMVASGALTFTAGAAQKPPLTPPTIFGVDRSGNVTTISFSSTNGVNYRLHYTDAAGLNMNVTNWPSLTTVPGGYPTTALQDTSSDATRFYKVEAFY